MAVDKLVDSSQLDASLTSVANAIRAKTGESGTMTLAQMPTKIINISTKESVTWHQCPTAVKSFLDEISYPSRTTVIWYPSFTATEGVITWSTSNSSIATVTSNDANSGLITAIERAEQTTNLTASISATRGSETLTLQIRVDCNTTYTGDKTIISCVTVNYAPSSSPVSSNTKPVGKTVDGITYYNEIPNIETPFSSTNVAGTLQPLDFLRWIKTTIASGTYYNLGTNTRDLGGWACDGGHVKYGIIIRGGEVNPDDKDLMVNKIGVKTEINLLDSSHRQFTGSPWNIDYVENPTDIDFAYQITGSNIIPMWRLYLSTLFESVDHSKPVYFHCGYGADKTGTVACIILGLLGVSESDMQKEFELTSFSIGYQGRGKMLPKLIDRINAIPLHSGLTDSFRNHVVSYVISLSDSTYDLSIEKINKFRSNCINGTPTQIVISCGITNTLTNCSNSNSANFINSGSSYSGTITANSGCTMESISVTMNGKDISLTAVSGNNISINSVSGDIVITAIATAPSYINQIPISTDVSGNVYNGTGYKNGYRINSSNSETTSTFGSFITGFIPVVAGDVLRFSSGLLKASASGSGQMYMVFYTSDKSVIGHVLMSGIPSYSHLSNVVTDADGYITSFTPKSSISGLAYIRFTLLGTGENSIVTVNQSIS